MPLFLAEQYVAGIDQAALDDLADALQRRAAAHWLASIAVPDDDLCFCIFRAANLSEVEALNLRAGVEYERVVPVIASPPSRFP